MENIENQANSESTRSARPKGKKKAPDAETTTLSIAQAFEQIATERRSVRKFDGSEVAPELIQKALDLALLAPNSSNLQSWEFYWIRTPEKRKRMVNIFLKQSAVRTCSELMVVVARTDTWDRNRKLLIDELKHRGLYEARNKSYYEKVVPLAYWGGMMATTVKWAISTARGLSKPTPREPVHDSDIRVWAVKSTSLAAAQFILALKSLGLDSCPMEGFDSARLRKELKLPVAAHVVMGIAIGRAAPGGIYAPRLRLDSKLFIKEV